MAKKVKKMKLKTKKSGGQTVTHNQKRIIEKRNAVVSIFWVKKHAT